MALLDGLHEDLNEIIQKPYVEQLESKGEPDHELAKESLAAVWKQEQVGGDGPLHGPIQVPHHVRQVRPRVHFI